MQNHRLAAGLVALISFGQPASAQFVQRNAQYWLPASYNNLFYHTFTDAARSFYAAHYAHFGVYEAAMSPSGGRADRMLQLRTEILRLVKSPPRFEPPIDVVAPQWTKLAPRTAAAMDWTHHLHEQLYDILTDERITNKKSAGERAISHYLTNTSAAFSTRGYGHAFMLGGGAWAGTFARLQPAINGILWAYHWHHAAVYEALMAPSADERGQGLDNVLRVFEDSVLADPPAYMPLTAQIGPDFSEMFPAAAHIFDNLHMMHDVVNDIMVDERVPLSEKGAEIDRLLDLMLYVNQDGVVPPTMPMDGHGGHMMMRVTVPTLLPDGRWLPQGHPRAKIADVRTPDDMSGGR